MSIQESDAIKMYTDPKQGYWGKTKQMKKYRMMLNKVYALQRHREVTSKHLKKLYKREGAIRPFFSVQVDLADFPKLQNPYNKNMRYLMVVIDVFSRYLWVEPLNSKEKLHIPLERVFARMKKEFGKTPANMTGDNEFDTNELKKMADKYKFRWWFGDPNEKYRTGIVERVIRTIRNLLKRYLSQNDTTKYVDVLDDLVANYNDTEHGHTRTRPRVAIKSGQTFPKPMNKQIPVLRAGDKVRVLQKRKKLIDKGDKPYYSKIVYEVVKKEGNKYVISNVDTGEILNKSYYIHQLQRIDGVIKDKYDGAPTDHVGYDQGVKHKTIQRRNKRRMRGLDLNNIIDKKERKQVQRGLRMNDKEVFHDKPLPKNISNKQLHKKQKQLEKKVKEKKQPISREQQLKNQIAMYKRQPRRNNQRIIDRIQKQLDSIRRVKKKKIKPVKTKKKKKIKKTKPVKAPIDRIAGKRRTGLVSDPNKNKRNKIKGEIAKMSASITGDHERGRMYVVRMRRKITKLRDQLTKLRPIRQKRIQNKK